MIQYKALNDNMTDEDINKACLALLSKITLNSEDFKKLINCLQSNKHLNDDACWLRAFQKSTYHAFKNNKTFFMFIFSPDGQQYLKSIRALQAKFNVPYYSKLILECYAYEDKKLNNLILNYVETLNATFDGTQTGQL